MTSVALYNTLVNGCSRPTCPYSKRSSEQWWILDMKQTRRATDRNVIGQDMSLDDAADLPFLNVKNGLALDGNHNLSPNPNPIRCRNSRSASAKARAGLTYLGIVCADLVGPPQLFYRKNRPFLVIVVLIHFNSMTVSCLPCGGASSVVGPPVHVHTVHIG